MRLTRLIAAAALPGVMASPVVAANPAASLSLHSEAAQTNTYPTEPDTTAPKTRGFGSTPLLIGGLAAILIIVGAIALGHNGSTPASA